MFVVSWAKKSDVYSLVEWCSKPQRRNTLPIHVIWYRHLINHDWSMTWQWYPRPQADMVAIRSFIKRPKAQEAEAEAKAAKAKADAEAVEQAGPGGKDLSWSIHFGCFLSPWGAPKSPWASIPQRVTQMIWEYRHFRKPPCWNMIGGYEDPSWKYQTVG